MQRWMTAEQVAERLSVSVATVYAYVSRGILESEPVPGSRTRRYPRAAVEAFATRRSVQKRPQEAVRQALDWGAPLLDSSIALIENGRLYYRGKDVAGLIREETPERVAALIWTGSTDAHEDLFAGEVELAEPVVDAVERLTDVRPADRLGAMLPIAGALDVAAFDARPGAFARGGARILRTMTLTLVHGRRAGRGPIAERLARGLSGERDAARVLGAALIACADHELNVSSFTARCVASAGASPWHVASAGLAALQGTRHGGHTDRVEAMLAELGTDDPRTALGGRLRAGEGIPGFGHPLYPDGDPRGKLLLELIREVRPRHPATQAALALVELVHDALGEHPTVDLGLAAVARALELPRGHGIALFALGRTIGWIGHAIEQIADGRLIRPRARYVGERP